MRPPSAQDTLTQNPPGNNWCLGIWTLDGHHGDLTCLLAGSLEGQHSAVASSTRDTSPRFQYFLFPCVSLRNHPSTHVSMPDTIPEITHTDQEAAVNVSNDHTATEQAETAVADAAPVNDCPGTAHPTGKHTSARHDPPKATGQKGEMVSMNPKPNDMTNNTFVIIDEEVKFHRFGHGKRSVARPDAVTPISRLDGAQWRRHAGNGDTDSDSGREEPHQVTPPPQTERPDRRAVFTPGNTQTTKEITKIVHSLSGIDLERERFDSEPYASTPLPQRHQQKARNRSTDRNGANEEANSHRAGPKPGAFLVSNTPPTTTIKPPPKPNLEIIVDTLIRNIQNDESLKVKLCQILKDNNPNFDPFQKSVGATNAQTTDMKGDSNSDPPSPQYQRLDLPEPAEVLWKKARSTKLISKKASSRATWLRELNDEEIQEQWASGEKDFPLYIRAHEPLLLKIASIRRDCGFLIQETVAQFLKEGAKNDEYNSTVILAPVEDILNGPSGGNCTFDQAVDRIASSVGRENAIFLTQLGKRKEALRKSQQDLTDFQFSKKRPPLTKRGTSQTQILSLKMGKLNLIQPPQTLNPPARRPDRTRIPVVKKRAPTLPIRRALPKPTLTTPPTPTREKGRDRAPRVTSRVFASPFVPPTQTRTKKGIGKLSPERDRDPGAKTTQTKK